MATRNLAASVRQPPSVTQETRVPVDVATPGRVDSWKNHRSWNEEVGHATAVTLTAIVRETIGKKVQGPMIATGRRWKRQHRAGQSATTISGMNLTALKQKLGNLNEHEKTFKARLGAAELYITHATDHPLTDGRAVLFSRKKLEEKGITFSKDNTHENDIKQLATDDNVFFALEVGDCQKSASRFGGTLHRFPFDQPVVKQQGMMHLFDALTQKPPKLGARFDAIPAIQSLSDQKRKAVKKELRAQAKPLRARNTLFHGPHIMEGLTLSIIDRCRTLPAEVRDEMLQDDDLNRTMNVLFRPQILVPRQFYGTPTDSIPIRKLDMNAANEASELSDSSSDSEGSDSDSDVSISDFDGSIGDSEGYFDLQELYTSAAQAPLTPPHSSSSEGGEWV